MEQLLWWRINLVKKETIKLQFAKNSDLSYEISKNDLVINVHYKNNLIGIVKLINFMPNKHGANVLISNDIDWCIYQRYWWWSTNIVEYV